MELPKEFASRFYVEGEICRSDSSVIYYGRDRTLGEHPVAIKVFFEQPEGNGKWIAAYDEQVAKLRAASHPVLVPIIAGGYERGWFYLVMELITGKTIDECIAAEKIPLPLDWAIHIGHELSAAVAELHENGICHGQIDPSAIMFKQEHPRLAGFCPSVIRVIQEARGMQPPVSRHAYIAPEQWTSGEVTTRQDVYAMGVVIFQLVTGQLPRLIGDEPESDSFSAVRKVNPTIVETLEAILRKAMSENPLLRYANMKEFSAALGDNSLMPKNPFLVLEPKEKAVDVGTQTVGVSMSTESIREILKAHESARHNQGNAETGVNEKTQSVKSFEATATSVDQPVYSDVTMQCSLAELRGAVGEKSKKALPASLIVIKGENRGRRFVLDRDNLIIGSAQSCEIVILGKNVPARYAIVLQKDDSYFIGALSSAPVEINHQALSGTGDYQLKRGDVISVGSVQLRFVEPGEVFTLQEDAAERVIDRPASRIGRYLGISAVVLLLFCGISFLVYKSTRSTEVKSVAKRTDQEANQRQILIARLQAEGDEFFRIGSLIEPNGANARRRFEQILELDPDHGYARRRISEIDERVRLLNKEKERKEQIARQVEKLLSEGERYLQSGSYVSPPGANARESFQSVFQYDPGNAVAQAKLLEIDNALKDLLGKINGLLTRAKALKTAGKYIAPKGECAFDLLNEVLQIDSNNSEAKDLIYDMAAQSILRGDQARAAADLSTMRQAYLTAQVLGVAPAYLNPRISGTDLIAKSRSEVIIVDRQDSSKGASAQEKSAYLDSTEIQRRIAEYQLQLAPEKMPGSRKFIDARSFTP